MNKSKEKEPCLYTLVSEEGLEMVSLENPEAIEEAIHFGRTAMITLLASEPTIEPTLTKLKALLDSGKKEAAFTLIDEMTNRGAWEVEGIRSGDSLVDAIVQYRVYMSCGQLLN